MKPGCWYLNHLMLKIVGSRWLFKLKEDREMIEPNEFKARLIHKVSRRSKELIIMKSSLLLEYYLGDIRTAKIYNTTCFLYILINLCSSTMEFIYETIRPKHHTLTWRLFLLTSINKLLRLLPTNLSFWENLCLTLLHGIRAVRFWDWIHVTTSQNQLKFSSLIVLARRQRNPLSKKIQIMDLCKKTK